MIKIFVVQKWYENLKLWERQKPAKLVRSRPLGTACSRTQVWVPHRNSQPASPCSGTRVWSPQDECGAGPPRCPRPFQTVGSENKASDRHGEQKRERQKTKTWTNFPLAIGLETNLPNHMKFNAKKTDRLNSKKSTHCRWIWESPWEEVAWSSWEINAGINS